MLVTVGMRAPGGLGAAVPAQIRRRRFGYPVPVRRSCRVRGFRFYFFSREERRPHVHVQRAEGEAKFWIDPTVQLHANYGLKPKRLAEAERLVEEHLNEIRSGWAKHFPN